MLLCVCVCLFAFYVCRLCVFRLYFVSGREGQGPGRSEGGVGVYGLILGRPEPASGGFAGWVRRFGYGSMRYVFHHCFASILGFLGVVLLGSWVRFLCFPFVHLLSVHGFSGLCVG